MTTVESAAASTPGHDPHDGVRVYDTVELADMDDCEDDQMYYYQCPCGDVFELSYEDLAKGERIAKCPSCSLRIRVVVPEDAST